MGFAIYKIFKEIQAKGSKTNEKYRERQTKEKEKEKLKQDGCNPKKKKPRKWVFLVNPVGFGGPTNNIPSPLVVG